MRQAFLVVLLMLAGCAASLPDPRGADVVLLGEQHDAQGHRDLQQRWVASLAARGQLGALALEMAERGTSTASLPRNASEAEVQAALRWSQQAWPWDRYRPAIMEAVRAGAPVLGANLPRAEQMQAMRDAALDRLLPGPALKAQQQAIRLGHCELLPESQIQPMTRIQIARDVAMAQTVASAVAPGKVVVLLAGAGHVEPELGVPVHLPPGVQARPVVLPPEPSGVDHCEALRSRHSRAGGNPGRPGSPPARG
ncbi:ChaN family lipoprotein [Ramlibacter sp. XY19]|uniref:ChaN family lipoprotein n=1 Tax=Ramlibacter paludis TaxID=2908000 RepID=UPI0023DABC4B|nr:ChaN family lipoprotein [Ramlibacter paludis]MCG2594828.1 ChaN family lipoprotein [Ramlibacter paludis]